MRYFTFFFLGGGYQVFKNPGVTYTQYNYIQTGHIPSAQWPRMACGPSNGQ